MKAMIELSLLNVTYLLPYFFDIPKLSDFHLIFIQFSVVFAVLLNYFQGTEKLFRYTNSSDHRHILSFWNGLCLRSEFKTTFTNKVKRFDSCSRTVQYLCYIRMNISGFTGKSYIFIRSLASYCLRTTASMYILTWEICAFKNSCKQINQGNRK